MSLSPLDERIIAEYIKNGGDKSKAYRKARGKAVAKWKPETIHTRACEFFKRSEVQVRLESIQAKAQEQTEIDAAYVLRRLQEIESIDDAVFYDDEGNLKPVHALPEHVRRSTGGMKVSRRSDEDGVETTVIEIKRESRTKALELMGRHVNVQAFKDQVEHSVTESLGQRLDAALKRRSDRAG